MLIIIIKQSCLSKVDNNMKTLSVKDLILFVQLKVTLIQIASQQMQEQYHHLIKRKPLNKSINNKIVRRRKAQFSMSPLENYHQQDKKQIQEREVQRNFGQNISLIAKRVEGSFISNQQDHSMDSFDKMIIGIDEELDIEVEDTSNSKEQEPNYTFLYQQFQRLIKYGKLTNQHSVEVERQQQNILQGDLFQQEYEKGKQTSFDMSNCGISNIKLVKEKIEEIREIKKQKHSLSLTVPSDVNISMRLLGANLSEIHEEEIQHNISLNRMDPIEEEFIDFVSKNNEAGKINISKIEKNTGKEEQKKGNKFKNQLNNSLKEPDEDEVVAMLENQLGSRRQNLIEEQSIIDEQSSHEKKQNKQEYFEKENYNQILRQLDENEDKKDNSNLNISSILSKRQDWIKNRADRSARWKQKELILLAKIKEIYFNPFVEFSDQESLNDEG